MRKLLILLVGLVSLINVSATKAQGNESVISMGVGTRTCTEFAKDYRQAPFAMETMYFSWAQGYMTATNYALLAQNITPYALNGLPIKEQEAIIRSYCNDHPLADYQDAVNYLESQKLPHADD